MKKILIGLGVIILVAVAGRFGWAYWQMSVDEQQKAILQVDTAVTQVNTISLLSEQKNSRNGDLKIVLFDGDVMDSSFEYPVHIDLFSKKSLVKSVDLAWDKASGVTFTNLPAGPYVAIAKSDGFKEASGTIDFLADKPGFVFDTISLSMQRITPNVLVVPK